MRGRHAGSAAPARSDGGPRGLACGARSKGLYADTDYREPLEKFEAYAGKLAEGGYFPKGFGSLVLRAFEAKRPRTGYAIVRGRLANWVLPTALPDR